MKHMKHMKYLKQYEELTKASELESEYKIGDLIIANPNFSTRYTKDVIDFFSTHIGEIISNHPEIAQSIRAMYIEEIPDNYGNKTNKYFNTWYFKPNEIRKATTEEVEKYKLQMTSNKYNL